MTTGPFVGYHNWTGDDDHDDNEQVTLAAPANQLRDLDDDYTRRGAPWDDRPDPWDA